MYDDMVEIRRQENRKLRMQLTAGIAGFAVFLAFIASLWIGLANANDDRPQIVTPLDGELVCEWISEEPAE